jgi:hypothetical protein
MLVIVQLDTLNSPILTCIKKVHSVEVNALQIGGSDL